MLARYGNNENKLVKTFVSRPAQKYLDAGFAPASIRKMVEDNKGNLPKMYNPKKDTRVKDLKPKKVRKDKSLLKCEVVKLVVVEDGKKVVVEEVVYPWSKDPQNFFLSPLVQLNLAEDTDTCHQPQHFLDDLCHGCPLYDRCGFKNKYGPEDYKNPKFTKKQVVIRKLEAWSQEELKALGL